MNFLNTFFAETESLWSQGPVTRDFEMKIVFDSGWSIWLLNISAYYLPAMKSFPRMLSKRLNQPAHAKIFGKYPKIVIEMQLSIINNRFNRHFEKPSRNPPTWTFKKIRYLEKKIGSAYAQSSRNCSSTESLAKIKRKESKFFFKYWQWSQKVLIEALKSEHIYFLVFFVIIIDTLYDLFLAFES